MKRLVLFSLAAIVLWAGLFVLFTPPERPTFAQTFTGGTGVTLAQARAGIFGTNGISYNNLTGTLSLSNSITTTTGTLTTLNVGGKLTLSGGIVNNPGFQHERVTTGGITQTSAAEVTVTWDVAFADTAYTPIVSLIHSGTGTTGLQPLRVTALTTTNCSVLILNNTAGTLTGTLAIHAVHD